MFSLSFVDWSKSAEGEKKFTGGYGLGVLSRGGSKSTKTPDQTFLCASLHDSQV